MHWFTVRLSYSDWLGPTNSFVLDPQRAAQGKKKTWPLIPNATFHMMGLVRELRIQQIERVEESNQGVPMDVSRMPQLSSSTSDLQARNISDIRAEKRRQGN